MIFRKIASLVLISSLLLGSTGVVSASSSNNNDVEAQISKIYQERADLLGEHKAGYEIEYEKLGKELESLGVDFLTPEEAQVVIAQKKSLGTDSSQIQPFVDLPASTNIVWSSFRSNWVKNGVTYEVQHVTAESNAQNSALKNTGVTFLSNSNSLQAGVSNLLVSAATTTLGSFNSYVGATITIYDAVKNFISDSNFSKTTTVKNISASYTWNWYESVDFMFIKEASKSDSYQSLALITSTVSGASAYSIPTFSYASTTGATTNATINQGSSKQFSYTALYHRDSSAAINYYLSGPTATSFITKITLTGIDGKTVQTITPAMPMGMGYLL
ncbi:hypothetical protein BSK49_08355 [Paenibacillus odorifer]|nr:hypothetical protein [Paenibacillus odorifer]OMD90576.1 hypothetical protein BSK49_08355 [Paenibacillus odorifer]